MSENGRRIWPNRFGSIDAMMAATEDEIGEVGGIGTVAWLPCRQLLRRGPESKTVIDKLPGGLSRCEDRPERSGGSDLAGMTIVLTRSVDPSSRDWAEELLGGPAANVTGSVSKKTSLVIAGEEAGSKADKARELGVADCRRRRVGQTLLNGESRLTVRTPNLAANFLSEPLRTCAADFTIQRVIRVS
ncbi:MAG: hypothetical protein R2845_03025 [Thermomicrobiales bacterium]